jgi:hypothetical protein
MLSTRNQVFSPELLVRVPFLEGQPWKVAVGADDRARLPFVRVAVEFGVVAQLGCPALLAVVVVGHCAASSGALSGDAANHQRLACPLFWGVTPD